MREPSLDPPDDEIEAHDDKCHCGADIGIHYSDYQDRVVDRKATREFCGVEIVDGEYWCAGCQARLVKALDPNNEGLSFWELVDGGTWTVEALVDVAPVLEQTEGRLCVK